MLRLVARARTFTVSSALAIATLGVVTPVPASAAAPQWNIMVGGGDFTQLSSLNRFYPNDITVHPGDVVRFNWGGFHTVTFNPRDNLSVFDYAGFSGAPVGSSTLDSPTTLVNGAPSFGPGGFAPFDVTIGSGLPDGAYAFRCSLHQFMKGVIRVTRGALPKTDAENQALGQAQMTADTARAANFDSRLTRETAHEDGEAVAGAGDRVVEFVKFYPSSITVHVGEELTFTDRDLHDPHTVTFGPVPGNPNDPTTGTFPSGPGNPNAFDGTSALNSGFLFHRSQYDYWNLKVSPVRKAVPRTEFSVTFTTPTKPGQYIYFYCDIHGQLNPDGTTSGMSGRITVLPEENGD